MDNLAKYYTRTQISDLLVGQMDVRPPQQLIDLGAGVGSLSRAAHQRWSNLNITTVDVDESISGKLIESLGLLGLKSHIHISADVLSHNLVEQVSASVKKIDRAVCNPPFRMLDWEDRFYEIVEEVGLSSCIELKAGVDAALLFLSQNLRLVGEAAEVGIIVPDSVVSASKYKNFRSELTAKYNLKKVIRLPEGSFKKTEAKASILILEKRPPQSEFLTLSRFHKGKNVSVSVPIRKALDRMDYDFHVQKNDRKRKLGKKAVNLGDIAEIKRGRFYSSEIPTLPFRVLHTTDVRETHLGCGVCFDKYTDEKIISMKCGDIEYAEPGDVLIARVGRNLEKKIVMIESGFPVISDCLYRVRTKKEWQTAIIKQLTSKEGQAWLSSRVYGVGARQLTKKDLSSFPVVL